jgi:hypothetical protein
MMGFKLVSFDIPLVGVGLNPLAVNGLWFYDFKRIQI